jgi:hypothetical protein
MAIACSEVLGPRRRPHHQPAGRAGGPPIAPYYAAPEPELRGCALRAPETGVAVCREPAGSWIWIRGAFVKPRVVAAPASQAPARVDWPT